MSKSLDGVLTKKANQKETFNEEQIQDLQACMDPDDGYMYFENGNKDVLKLRGYVMGMTWLGRTSEWTRIK